MRLITFFLALFPVAAYAMYADKLFCDVTPTVCSGEKSLQNLVEEAVPEKKVNLSVNKIEDPEMTELGNLVDRVQQIGHKFQEELKSTADEAKSEHELYAEQLLFAYQGTVEHYSPAGSFIGLLKDVEFNLSKRVHYRVLCRVIVPFMLAFNESFFSIQAKADALILFQEYAKPLLEKKVFVFKATGIPYDDAYKWLKLNVLYHMCLIDGRQELIDRLKTANKDINFDHLNFIEAIADFDLSEKKEINIIEEKGLSGSSEERANKKKTVNACLGISPGLKNAQAIVPFKNRLDQSWFIFCYSAYKEFANQPETKPILKDFFWNIYLWDRLEQLLERLIDIPTIFLENMALRVLKYIFGEGFNLNS